MAAVSLADKAKNALGSATLVDFHRELAKRSLADFVRMAWHVIEPDELKWGWALDAICEHLEAVTSGDIRRLLMNVPPGSMKSLLTGVFWPAWEWGPRGLAHNRFIGTAHSVRLAVRDNIKARRLISSPWYQRRWPITLMRDQNSSLKFENDKTGFREGMPFTSMTGARGHRVILDDPLSVDDANSEAALYNAALTFREALPSRVVNRDSAIIVIMQRLHWQDTSGIIIENGLPYEHLMIPMRFEADRVCSTSIGWTDPRTIDGELMFPERFDEEYVAAEEETMGSYAVAGQFQQRPTPREGGMFQPDNIVTIPAIPDGDQIEWARGWDLAGTDGGGAYTAGVKVGWSKTRGRAIIADVRRDRKGPGGVRNMVSTTAEADYEQHGDGIVIVLPQDPGQAGKAQAQSFRIEFTGYRLKIELQSGSKETRAEPLANAIEAGQVDMVEGPWNKALVDEMRQFGPLSHYKDQVDACASAFNQVAPRRKKKSPLAVIHENVGNAANWA